jgi:hypothetical protein
LKEKIQNEQSIMSSLQKLIIKGKVMEDNKTLGEYNIKEGDFLVIMVSKVMLIRIINHRQSPLHPTKNLMPKLQFLPSQPVIHPHNQHLHQQLHLAQSPHLQFPNLAQVLLSINAQAPLCRLIPQHHSLQQVEAQKCIPKFRL